MRQLLPLMAAVAVAGCATAPVADVRQVFADRLFATVERPPVDDDIFAMSDEMKALADQSLGRLVGRARHGGLADFIKREIRIDYDAGVTRAAAGTFDERAGNCLSLVILTSAFAKHFDIPFEYQSVYGQDAWSRLQGMAFLNGHVNIKMRNGTRDGVTIDFMEQARSTLHSTRVIDEATVRAMYLNNRAAEALVAGDGAAYWWARAAIGAAPGYISSVNTLGVIYLRSGALPEAEQALRYVLGREPDNAIALTNLVQVYARQGRDAEAREARARLAAIEPYPPFYFLDQGLAALERGEYEKARELLNRELRRMPFHDEVHFALALADLREGEKDDARRHLSMAVKYSPTRERRDIYSAKLSHLRGVLN
jgi:tetratricopeptide (TPR) repeat protein